MPFKATRFYTFLEGIEITPDDYELLCPWLSNWLTLSEQIKNRCPSTLELKKLMLIELNQLNRSYILYRLHSKMCTTRLKTERAELEFFDAHNPPCENQ